MFQAQFLTCTISYKILSYKSPPSHLLANTNTQLKLVRHRWPQLNFLQDIKHQLNLLFHTKPCRRHNQSCTQTFHLQSHIPDSPNFLHSSHKSVSRCRKYHQLFMRPLKFLKSSIFLKFLAKIFKKLRRQLPLSLNIPQNTVPYLKDGVRRIKRGWRTGSMKRDSRR